jgi:hypothetical protein
MLLRAEGPIAYQPSAPRWVVKKDALRAESPMHQAQFAPGFQPSIAFSFVTPSPSG